MSLPLNIQSKIYFKRNKSFSSQLEDSLALTHTRRFSTAERNRRIFLIFLIGGKKISPSSRDILRRFEQPVSWWPQLNGVYRISISLNLEMDITLTTKISFSCEELPALESMQIGNMSWHSPTGLTVWREASHLLIEVVQNL